MNRREMLFASAAGILGIPVLARADGPPVTDVSKAPDLPPELPWFTHQVLMHIYNVVSKSPNSAKETNKEIYSDELFVSPPSPALVDAWTTKQNSMYESFYLSMLRVTNIMHRKTLANNCPWWVVLPPQLALDVLPKYTLSEKWNPEAGWRNHIREEVTPGVYRIGTLNCRWVAYIDENFPEGVAMLGMGYKTVQRFRFDKDAQSPDDIKTYTGPPTDKHYGLITCER